MPRGPKGEKRPADVIGNAQAATKALESALAQEVRPLRKRIADIARDAARLGSRKRGRAVKKREIDELWGNG